MGITGRHIRPSGAASTGGALLAVATLLASACSISVNPGGHHTTVAGLPARAARQLRAPVGPATPAAGPIGRLGSYYVGQVGMTFYEPAHRGVTGAWLRTRKLLTWIRYPLAGPPSLTTRPAKGPFPLLVFAPGFMQCGGPYSRLLQAWATAGYVVVAVNFPHSDCYVGQAATEADMINQPGDMSQVITRMLAASAAHGGLLSGMLNPKWVAVTGQSDGGDTVAAIAANTCCGDHRVVAVAVLSGAEWAPMPGRYFTRRPVPMLFTQGSADTINPPACSVAMYRADPALARYYLDLLGASHTRPYWGTNAYERVVARVSLDFFDRYVLGQSAAAMARAGNVNGVAVLVGGRHLAPSPSGRCPGAPA